VRSGVDRTFSARLLELKVMLCQGTGITLGAMTTITCKIPERLDAELEAVAEKRGVSKSEVVREAIEANLPEEVAVRSYRLSIPWTVGQQPRNDGAWTRRLGSSPSHPG